MVHLDEPVVLKCQCPNKKFASLSPLVHSSSCATLEVHTSWYKYASSKSNLVPYSVNSDNTLIDLKSNIRLNLMGKEEWLMESELAETYGKTVELGVMLMRTKMHER